MMTLNPLPGVLPAISPSGVNVPFSVSGGSPPYTFALNGVGLPLGLALSSGGQLTGQIDQLADPPSPYACNVCLQFVVTDATQDCVRGVYYLPVRPQ